MQFQSGNVFHLPVCHKKTMNFKLVSIAVTVKGLYTLKRLVFKLKILQFFPPGCNFFFSCLMSVIMSGCSCAVGAQSKKAWFHLFFTVYFSSCFSPLCALECGQLHNRFDLVSLLTFHKKWEHLQKVVLCSVFHNRKLYGNKVH